MTINATIRKTNAVPQSRAILPADYDQQLIIDRQNSINQQAATAWALNYGEHLRNAGEQRGERPAIEKALAVLVLTDATRNYLAANDPKALEQATRALNGQSFTEYK
jgi:hypothetical protein